MPPVEHSVTMSRLSLLPPSLFDPLPGFQVWYRPIKVVQIRYSAFITALLYPCYGLIEASMDLAPLQVWFHIAVVPLTLLLIAILSFSRRLHNVMYALLMVIPCAAPLFSLYINLQTPLSPYFVPELYLNLLWTFVISGLPLGCAFITATSTLLGALILIELRGTPDQFLLLNLLWTGSAYLFGLVGAVVLEQAYRALFQQQRLLEHSASTDSLTTLWNREKMGQLFDQVTSADPVGIHPVSVIMLDIDHFKQVNDQHGHAVGDHVLSSFANLLRLNVRQHDQVGRIGGEEFFILLPDTDEHRAHVLASHLQSRINGFEFERVGHKSASFGIAQYRPHETLAQLLSRADQALYRAKANGRNRIEVG